MIQSSEQIAWFFSSQERERERKRYADFIGGEERKKLIGLDANAYADFFLSILYYFTEKEEKECEYRKKKKPIF